MWGLSILGLLFHAQSLYDDNKLDVSELKNTDAEFDVPTLSRPFGARCLPFTSFNVFQMVEELGLAADIKKEHRRDSLLEEPEIVTAEEIEKGIKCVNCDSEMRKRVEEMKGMLGMALLDGGSSKATMRMFVKDVIENIPKNAF